MILMRTCQFVVVILAMNSISGLIKMEVMSYILAMLIGGAIGVIAETVPVRQRRLLAIINGATGALLSLWFFSDILHVDPIVSFGTISVLNIFYGILGSVLFIALTDYAIEKEYDLPEDAKAHNRTISLAPVYAHQYEEVDIRHKKTRRRGSPD